MEEFDIAHCAVTYHLHAHSLYAIIFVGKCEPFMSQMSASVSYGWWNSQKTTMTGQICRKVIEIGQNCKVAQVSQRLVEFELVEVYSLQVGMVFLKLVWSCFKVNSKTEKNL